MACPEAIVGWLYSPGVLQFLSSFKGPVGPIYFVLNILRGLQPLSCLLVSLETLLDGPWPF